MTRIFLYELNIGNNYMLVEYHFDTNTIVLSSANNMDTNVFIVTLKNVVEYLSTMRCRPTTWMLNNG